ncbi:MAG: hypothetical protein Q8934_06435 [Bacillota bacterium]|nr:hypothetical protein [Bacillota bacterium]
MKKWVFFSILGAIILTGCNQGANDAAYDLRKDKSAPQFMSNRVTGNDINNQNPNFLPLKGTKGGAVSSQGHRVDVEKAKQVIKSTKEFTPGSIWMNGDRMWVTVYKKGMFTQREKIAAEARVHRQLIEALPRYNIEVNVRQDRR